MKKNLLKTGLLLLISMLFVANLSAQGTYGGTLLFNMACSDSVSTIPSWTWPASGNFTKAKNGYTFTVQGISTTRTARAKTFTTVNNATTTPATSIAQSYAAKCTGVTIQNLASLGQINLFVQNGSSGTAGLFKTQISSDGGTTWTTVDSITLAGNAATIISPSNVISRSGVKVQFVFPWACWFFGVSAYDHKDAANAANGPTLLSATPVSGSSLSASGSIALQYDELLKAGTGTATLGNATITSMVYSGNIATINYTGYTDATNPLAIPTSVITDFSGTPIATAVSIPYNIDVTPPTFSSVLPANNSTIHINDLGLDANKIKLTFSEPIQLGTGTVTFNTTGIVTTSVSGNVLTIGFSNLPYNASNTLTIPATFIKDLTGNQMALDVTLTYNTGARDATPPTLTAQSVANLAIAQPIGGSIYFTFNEIVVPTSTPVTINGAPAYISNNGNVIGLNYTNLPYGSTVNVVLPAGCVTDTCGNAYAGTSFSFTTAAKTAKAFDYVVAKDGSGDFTTIQAAITAASGTARTFIYVKKGVYNEKLLMNKANVSLIGENADSVIISWGECSSTSTLQPGTGITSTGTDASYTMLIAANGFYGENFTVRNSYNYNTGLDVNKQAVALEHINADKGVLKNVKMYSYQDTYYPKSVNTRQYLLNCFIQGGTDFIFGSGSTYIDNATLKCVQGGQYIVAASGTSQEFGVVLNGCNASYTPDSINMGTIRQFYLGRPWQNPAKTTYINCKFDATLLMPAGWSIWSGTNNHLSAVYSEYNSTDLSSTPLSLTGRVSWSSQLTANQASRYNPDNVFNYGATTGTWNPIPCVTAPLAPTTPTIDNTGVINWTASDFAVGYLVFRNDTLIGKTTATTFGVPSYNPSAIYSIKASNEYGALSMKSVASILSGIKNAKVKSGFLVSTLVSNEIDLVNPTNFSSVEVIDFSGKKLIEAKVTGATLNIAGLQVGCYLVKGIAKNGDLYVDKIIKN